MNTNNNQKSNREILQLLYDSFKKEYPNINKKSLHAINAFVLYCDKELEESK